MFLCLPPISDVSVVLNTGTSTRECIQSSYAEMKEILQRPPDALRIRFLLTDMAIKVRGREASDSPKRRVIQSSMPKIRATGSDQGRKL
jgi:hypothetical protein